LIARWFGRTTLRLTQRQGKERAIEEPVVVSAPVTTSCAALRGIDQHVCSFAVAYRSEVLSYTGNVVVTPWTNQAVVPYATGGVGGLTMFERLELGVTKDETFFSGNVGGGIKWYAPNKRWRLRADYRFAATQSKDDAPEFFGRDTRYVHRIYCSAPSACCRAPI
jgi:opacity protein-like surface antigen